MISVAARSENTPAADVEAAGHSGCKVNPQLTAKLPTGARHWEVRRLLVVVLHEWWLGLVQHTMNQGWPAAATPLAATEVDIRAKWGQGSVELAMGGLIAEQHPTHPTAPTHLVLSKG